MAIMSSSRTDDAPRPLRARRSFRLTKGVALLGFTAFSLALWWGLISLVTLLFF